MLEDLRAEMTVFRNELAAASRESAGLRDDLRSEAAGRARAESRDKETQRLLEQTRAESTRAKASVRENDGRATTAVSQIGKL